MLIVFNLFIYVLLFTVICSVIYIILLCKSFRKFEKIQ